MARKPESPKLKKIVPGKWLVELLSGGTLHLGGAINQKPAPHPVEFSFVTLPAFAAGPGNVGLPAVVLFMAPAEPVAHEHPGSFTQNGLATMVHLFTNRALFTDLLQKLESGKIRHIEFKAEEGAEGELPISSWSITSTFPTKS